MKIKTEQNSRTASQVEELFIIFHSFISLTINDQGSGT